MLPEPGDYSKDLPPILAQLADLMHESVAFGSNLLGALVDAPHNPEIGKEETLARVLATLRVRDAIGMLDGIEGLVRISRPEPAIPCLRVLLEQSLQFDYLTAELFVERAYNSLVVQHNEDLRWYEMFDPATDRGREFAKLQQKVGMTTTADTAKEAGLEKQLQWLRDRLGRPQGSAMQRAAASLTKFRVEKPRAALNWYSLDDGPANMNALALHLNRGVEYAVFYRRWSGKVHGSSTLDNLHMSTDGKGSISRLRWPVDAEEVTSEAVRLAASIMQTAVHKLQPDFTARFDAWYSAVREPFLAIGSKRRVRVELP